MGVQKDGGKRIYTFVFDWGKMDFTFFGKELAARRGKNNKVQT
ncbi:MAG: hypothetical protein PHH30_00020 [Bacteroidales bacterium]|nr:hypothetical protein [Bacteroidales bacterium]MDD3861123.1 hypothetical protein [Bacteroidales bacterium]